MVSGGVGIGGTLRANNANVTGTISSSQANIGNGKTMIDSSGTIVKQFKLPGKIFSSPIILKNILNELTLFVGCRDNYLYCLNITLKYKKKFV